MKDYFYDAFMVFKIGAIAENDEKAIQSAFFWEISVRKRPIPVKRFNGGSRSNKNRNRNFQKNREETGPRDRPNRREENQNSSESENQNRRKQNEDDFGENFPNSGDEF